jgi:hypothetical protein
MVGIIVFHVLMLALGLSIAVRVVPAQLISSTLGYLHKSIGITTPTIRQVRMAALIWIGSIVVILDGCLFLLLLITKFSHPE